MYSTLDAYAFHFPGIGIEAFFCFSLRMNPYLVIVALAAIFSFVLLNFYFVFPVPWSALISFNVGTFFLFVVDKNASHSRGARIPERVFFFFSIPFGAIGMVLGCYILRHKTKVPAFSIGLVVLVMIQIVLLREFGFRLDDLDIFVSTTDS